MDAGSAGVVPYLPLGGEPPKPVLPLPALPASGVKGAAQ